MIKTLPPEPEDLQSLKLHPSEYQKLGEIAQRSGHLKSATLWFHLTLRTARKRRLSRILDFLEPLWNNIRQYRLYLIISLAMFLMVITILVTIEINAINHDARLAVVKSENSRYLTWLAYNQYVSIFKKIMSSDSGEITFPDYSQKGLSLNEILRRLRQGRNPFQGSVEQQLQVAKENISDNKDRLPPFNPPSGPPFKCRPIDIPSDDGDCRYKQLSGIMLSSQYYSFLGNGQKIAGLIDFFSSNYGWRQSEDWIKGRLEQYAIAAYTKAGNYEKAKEHAERCVCAGNDGIFSGYALLADLYSLYQPKNKEKAKLYLKAAEHFLEYANASNKYKKVVLSEWYRSVGASAWYNFSDINWFINCNDIALSLLENSRHDQEREETSNKEIDDIKEDMLRDRLEMLTFADRQGDDFRGCFEKIEDMNVSSESDWIIIRTLESMHFVLIGDRKNAAAIIESHILPAWDELVEFTGDWIWSGARQQLIQLHETQGIDDLSFKTSLMLIDAAEIKGGKTHKKRQLFTQALGRLQNAEH